MRKEGLTPIREVNRVSDRLEVKLKFPSWLDSEAIGFNLPRVHRAMSWGGIRHLVFQGISESKSGYALPTSVARDGSATASVVRTRSITDDLSSTLFPGRMPIRNSQWANLHLRVNLEELREKIDGDKAAIRNPENWTKELDARLRAGIRKGGLKHLLTGLDTSERGLSFVANFGTAVIGIGLLRSLRERYNPLGTSSFKYAVLAQLCTLFMFNVAGVHSDGLEKKGTGYRMNLLPGFELDRALLLLSSTRQSKPLIKVIKDQK